MLWPFDVNGCGSDDLGIARAISRSGLHDVVIDVNLLTFEQRTFAVVRSREGSRVVSVSDLEVLQQFRHRPNDVLRARLAERIVDALDRMGLAARYAAEDRRTPFRARLRGPAWKRRAAARRLRA
jgi:hypothetical protein